MLDKEAQDNLDSRAAKVIDAAIRMLPRLLERANPETAAAIVASLAAARIAHSPESTPSLLDTLAEIRRRVEERQQAATE